MERTMIVASGAAMCPVWADRRSVVIAVLLVAMVPTFCRSAELQNPQEVPSVEDSRIRIAIVGDSTVASYPRPPADRPDLTGWGQVLEEFFSDDVEIINHARSGRSSKSFIREGLWEGTLATRADFVLIQFGHNDSPGKGDRSTDPDGDFRDYLRQYIRDARLTGMRPVLVTPMTRRRFQDGRVHTLLGPWAEAMRVVAREEQVPLVDLHTASVDLLNRLGDAGSADLSASSSDRTHFSRKGGLAMAGLVADGLIQAVPELKPYRRQDRSTSVRPSAAERQR